MLRPFAVALALAALIPSRSSIFASDGLKAESLKVGQFGPFSTEMDGRGGPVGNSRIYIVQQVLNDQEAIIRGYRYPVVENMKAPPPREGGESFWLKGVSTKGWVDDKVVTLEGNFKVTGTKQYKTVLGAPRTVFLVEAETEAERKDRLRELAAQDQARKKAASERQAIRQEENKKRLEREKAEEQKKKTDAPKAEAARKLRFAKQYLREAIGQNDAKEADRLNELARKHLQEIVDNFAETPSATEAKKLLEKLK